MVAKMEKMEKELSRQREEQVQAKVLEAQSMSPGPRGSAGHGGSEYTSNGLDGALQLDWTGMLRERLLVVAGGSMDDQMRGSVGEPIGASLADDLPPEPDPEPEPLQLEPVVDLEAAAAAQAAQEVQVAAVRAAAEAEAAARISAAEAEIAALKAAAATEAEALKAAAREEALAAAAAASAAAPAAPTPKKSQAESLFGSDSDDDTNDPLQRRSQQIRSVFDDGDDTDPLSPFTVEPAGTDPLQSSGGGDGGVAEGVPPSRLDMLEQASFSVKDAVAQCTSDDTEDTWEKTAGPLRQLAQLAKTAGQEEAVGLAKCLSERLSEPIIPVKLKSLQLVDKLLKVGSQSLHVAISEQCSLAVKQSAAFRERDPAALVDGRDPDRPAEMIRAVAVNLLKLISMLAMAANPGRVSLPQSTVELPRVPRRGVAASSLRGGGTATGGWQASVSKAMGEWTEKVTTWTTSWTLDLFPDDVITGRCGHT